MAGDTYHGPGAGQDGDHNTQYNHFYGSAPRPVVWPHQVGVIPPKAGGFQDRAEADRLREVVAAGGTAVLGQAQPPARQSAAPVGGGVLSGMGGVGKTQLVADYARTAWTAGEVDLLVWVTATDRAAVVAGLGRAGVQVTGADASDPVTAAEAFIAWLEPKSHERPCRWLLVLDDIADPGDLAGLWPPASPHGRTLITTRRRDAAFTLDGRTRIEVGLFTPAEALSYLTTVLAAHDRDEPVGELAALAEDLGHLPLALSQAAAFMIDASMPCDQYRTLLTDRSRTLADASPQPLPPGHTLQMSAAWDLSIRRADTMRPPGLAGPLLHLASLLDPNGIPGTVLTTPPALAYLSEHRASGPSTTGQATPEVSATDVTAGLRVLHRLSLIDHTLDDPHHSVRVHALIQRAVRDTFSGARHRHTARAAADALVAAWPEVERDTALAQALRANTTALTAHAETALHQPGVHLVLLQAGHSLGESGQVTAAIAYHEHLAAATTRHLGRDHPDTLTTRYELAFWRGRAGDAAGAATAFAELLADRSRVLGPDHSDTLATRHDLAYWRGVAGDPAGAATATAELLASMVRVLGPDHPHTLITRGNLARWRGQAGDPGAAATATAELLADQLRVLGPDHLHTLITRHNLAHWQGVAGDAGGAATSLAEVLEDQVRVLGPDHPETLLSRHNLAQLWGRAGDAAGAADAFAELLADQLRVLGPDHPHTLATRHNLAHWRARSGKDTSTPG